MPASRMKIDIVTDTFLPDVNGVAMTIGRLCHGLRARGHKVHVLHTGSQPGPDETVYPAIHVPGYKEVRVGLPQRQELRNRWLKRRPDAIYVATESPLGKSAIKAATYLGIPIATGFHTNFHQYMEMYAIRGLQPVAMAYLKRFHQRADCVLTPSREMVDRLKAEGLGHVYLLGRGVDTGLFAPQKRSERLRQQWGADATTPVVTIVGRVAPEKNFDLAILTMEQLRKTDPRVTCVVVGDGPLRQQLATLYPWIHFAGVQTGEDLAAHYASADVLLFPSETETFGNVLLEGMASGLATVSFDYAASAMHVRHGENGFKAPKGDQAAFIRAASTAIALPLLDHPLRRNARATAEALGWTLVIDEFEHRLQTIAANKPAIPTPREAARRARFSCRTVILSDIHLGTPESKAAELLQFLKHVDCEKLILNGDIIDGWALRRGGRWTAKHSRVIRKFLKMTEQDHTRVIYLRGNHDDILERFLPLSFGRVEFLKEHIHLTANQQPYLIVHGDGFDSVTTRHKWLAKLGAIGYDFLLQVNRVFNAYRAWRGKEYYSLSKHIKAKVKSAVGFIDNYEQLLQDLARHRKCVGIICGHIHTPDDKHIGDIHYLNSGDWVESLTAIIEHHDGRLELVRHAQFLASLPEN